MDSDNQELIFCADAVEYRIYCHIRDNFAIDLNYENHLKSQFHNIITHKRQQNFRLPNS